MLWVLQKHWFHVSSGRPLNRKVFIIFFLPIWFLFYDTSPASLVLKTLQHFIEGLRQSLIQLYSFINKQERFFHRFWWDYFTSFFRNTKNAIKLSFKLEQIMTTTSSWKFNFSWATKFCQLFTSISVFCDHFISLKFKLFST